MLYNYLIKEYENYDLLSQEEKNSLVHVNCCEKILFGMNNVYELGLDENALKLARGFGGGMNVESTCGVITGGIMGLSNLFYNAENYKDIMKDFINLYANQYTSISCDILKEKYRTEKEGCRSVILNAALILDDVVSKYSDRGDFNEKD